jgi:hypothetical protein
VIEMNVKTRGNCGTSSLVAAATSRRMRRDSLSDSEIARREISSFLSLVLSSSSTVNVSTFHSAREVKKRGKERGLGDESRYTNENLSKEEGIGVEVDACARAKNEGCVGGRKE